MYTSDILKSIHFSYLEQIPVYRQTFGVCCSSFS